MNELHLFAGAGGGILGSELLGFRTVCAVELEPYPASVLLARQNDGLLPPFPVWDDVRTFDGRPWRGLVDVVSGGFPCQDISSAGKGAGIDGERSGLWREMHRIINEVRPRYAFLENSPLLVGRGLARVLGDLAEIGYDAEWLVLGADDVGAPHVRKRIWILAHDPHANDLQRPQQGEPFMGPKVLAGCSFNRLDSGDDVSESPCLGSQETWPEQQATGIVRICPDVSNAQHQGNVRRERQFPENEILGIRGGCYDGRTETNDCGEWWSAEPAVGRVAHGVAARVDRLKAIGNGQVSAVAATAFRVLLGRLMNYNPQLTLF